MGLITKHIYVIVVPEGEEKEGGAENVFGEIMAEEFLNLQIQEAE